MLRASPTADPMPNIALAPSLADLLPAQVLELRPCRPVDVMVLAGKAVLPGVRQWVVLVTPVAGVVEPICRSVGRAGAGEKALGGRIVQERVGVLRRIPERASVGLIVQKAERKDIGVQAGGGIHGVGAGGTVDYRTLGATGGGSVRPCSKHRAGAVLGGQVLFDSMVCVCLTKIVLGKVDILGSAVDEAHHGMLPVTYVIAEADVENGVAEVERVEKEPESVDDTVFFGDDNEDGRCAAPATLLRSVSLTIPIGITLLKVAMRGGRWVQRIETFASKRVAGLVAVRITVPAIPVD